MSILDDITETMSNKSVMGGFIGSISGYIIADYMGYDMPKTILMIGTGHFTGHLIALSYLK